VRKRVTINKLKVMTIYNMREDQWIPESKFIVHIKGFGNGLNGEIDGTILEDILSSSCRMLVWDGDLLEETGFTKMVPQFLNMNSEAKALAFVLDYEVDDFRESWEQIIEQYPDRIRVVAVDMKPPIWRDAADHGITEELKDAQGLPEWAQEYFLVGRLACKATDSKQVFSLGGGGISAHEAKASADSGVEWTVYALSRGREEAYPTLADWAAENPGPTVRLRLNLDPDEDMAFCNVDNRKKSRRASRRDRFAVQALLQRQRDELPGILEELEQNNRKTGHWAWWVFPTELAGDSEPSPETYVTHNTADMLLEEDASVTEWCNVLEKICELVEERGMRVLPRIDHGRVHFFLKFWQAYPDSPERLQDVLSRLDKFDWPPR